MTSIGHGFKIQPHAGKDRVLVKGFRGASSTYPLEIMQEGGVEEGGVIIYGLYIISV